MANLVANSSGDEAGNYYTGSASDLASVPVSNAVNPQPYECPATDSNYGPFTGQGYSAATFGPVGTHKVWTPFAAWNGQQAVLPLPHTIEATANGFQFSKPPVFNSGNNYVAQLPNDDTQPPAQYYGNNQSDFYVAPAASLTQPVNAFPLPTSGETAFTQLEGFSDWAATVSLSNASESLEVTFANGSPLAFLTLDTEYAWFQPSTASPIIFLTPYFLPSVVAPPIPGTNQCPADSLTSSPPCTLFNANWPTYAVGESYPITWASLGVGPDTNLDLYISTDGGTSWTLLAGDIPNSSPYTWTPTAAQVTGQNTFTGQFWLVLHGQDVTTGDPNASALSVPFAVVGSASELPANQPSLTSAPQPPADTTFGTQYVDDPHVPLTSWYPQGYEIQPPFDGPPGESLGITITGFGAAGSGGGQYYQSSYLLIAPSGSQWTVENGGAALACQFPSSSGGTIIVVAMPDVSAEAYASYYTPETGAAAVLQSYWAVMQPYAYGCPRHLDGDGNDDGTGTQLGPNAGNQFTPRVTSADGTTTVTTEFYYNLTFPLGQPDGAYNATLFGLFPHQWRAYANNTSTPLQTADGTELTYRTVMGTLKLCGGDGFSTNYTFPGILPALPNAAQLTGNEVFNVYDYPAGSGVNPMSLIGQMLRDASTPVWSANNFGASSPGAGGTSPAQNDFIPVPPSNQQNWGIDSYDWGKFVAGVADLIQPAFMLGANFVGEAAISQLNAQLGQWLSGALLYADDTTPWPPGVSAWQMQQGNTTLAGETGLSSNQQFLYYDQQWFTFIPYPTAYYADTLLNDHHFHYGYWLRAASQLALAQASGQDPDNAAGTFIANYGATVNLLVKELANPLRADQGAVGDSAASFPGGPATPFLRHFDGYFGHSWASGLPQNILNQESLSEAMSAWTGVIMWGELTGNTDMRDLGVWMYTHEMYSFYEYWMDCAQNASEDSALFPAGSTANIADPGYAVSIQGGDTTSGVGFCTQVYNSYLELTSDFGMDPLFLTGIEWLPFHGGSLYLSSTDAAVSTTLQAVYQWSQANSQYQWNQWQQATSPAKLSVYQPTYLAASWEPVMWNHAATLGEDTAADIWAELEQAVGSDGASLNNQPAGGWKPLGGESVSYSYYWINNISALGARDAATSADYPFAVKFLNGATATYVVWNLTGASLDVNFSDGRTVSGVAAHSLQVSPASS
ncbi:MAG: hypothetical protein JOZ96_22405 [Acidobacteria bacterium]|nr:hypothetical protein [Acidobacteriota bacterium]